MGKQELPSTIYTDLYAIDLKTLNVSLVWKSQSKELDLPGGNMIIIPWKIAFMSLPVNLADH